MQSADKVCRDKSMMIGDFAVVYDALVDVKSLLLQKLYALRVIIGKALDNALHQRYHIIRQITAVRARVCQQLLFIERLSRLQRICRRDSVNVIGFAL